MEEWIPPENNKLEGFLFKIMYYRQENKCYPKGVYLRISKLHSNLAVANLLAHNNKSKNCYCGQISLQSAAVNCSFSDNLTPLGVTFILLAMVPRSMNHSLQFVFFTISRPFVLIFELNPLLPELFFQSIFETLPKTGSFRLPTHRRGTHRKFFPWSLLILKSKFWSNWANSFT